VEHTAIYIIELISNRISQINLVTWKIKDVSGKVTRALYKKSKEANFTIMKGNTWQIMCRQNVHWGVPATTDTWCLTINQSSMQLQRYCTCELHLIRNSFANASPMWSSFSKSVYVINHHQSSASRMVSMLCNEG